MITQGVVRIKNFQREQKLKSKKQKSGYCLTPPKYKCKPNAFFQLGKKQTKFGYDYDYHYSYEQCKPIQYMKEEFLQRSWRYLGGHHSVKVLKTKDKYERNIETGRPFRQNPLIKIFNKIESKINRADKLVAFHAIKSSAY